jgi:hypothetical protein
MAAFEVDIYVPPSSSFISEPVAISGPDGRGKCRCLVALKQSWWRFCCRKISHARNIWRSGNLFVIFEEQVSGKVFGKAIACSPRTWEHNRLMKPCNLTDVAITQHSARKIANIK